MNISAGFIRPDGTNIKAGTPEFRAELPISADMLDAMAKTKTSTGWDDVWAAIQAIAAAIVTIEGRLTHTG